jgi:putative transport protein
VLLAACITIIPLLITMLIGRLMYKMNMLEIFGLLAGASTDPPALSFAIQSSGTDAPAVAYAGVYPLTMFLRIMAAQLLVLLFV